MKFRILVASKNGDKTSYEDEVDAASEQDLKTMYGILGIQILKILGIDNSGGNVKPLPPPPTVNAQPTQPQPISSQIPGNGNLPPIKAAPVEDKIFTDGDNIFKISADGMYKKEWTTIDESSYRLMKKKPDESLTEMKNDSIIVQIKKWKKIETSPISGDAE